MGDICAVVSFVVRELCSLSAKHGTVHMLRHLGRERGFSLMLMFDYGREE